MPDFVLFTDSGSDISPATLKEWGVQSLPLTLRFEGEDTEYRDGEMDIHAFYTRMREGGVAKTAAINPERFADAFRPILKSGKDILYLGFSSGLSTTYNSSRLAALQLAEEFPERQIVTFDTLSASAGQGLLVYLAACRAQDGASLTEVYDYVKTIAPKLCHWFTVDDLVYLKRGGRLSAASAFVGGLIGIKPVLHADDAGKLSAVSKVRGRRTALTALADKYGELSEDAAGGTVFISHADCAEEAAFLADTLADRFGATVSVITDIGAVIGSHSGPGTMALFFIGKER